MRLIVGISLMLLGFGTLLCRVDVLSARSPEAAVESVWVRTADGWERPDSWHVTGRPAPPFHPLILAAGQALGSMLSLAAFQREGRRCLRWNCC